MSQFGGTRRADDYGFFGPSKPSGTSGQFGGPPATASPSPAPLAGTNPAFGAPAPAGFDYASQPAFSGPAGQKSGLGAGRVLGLLGIVALLLIAGWFGWTRHQLSQPVQVPATLIGLPLASDPEFEALVLEAEDGVRQQNPGRPAEAAAYGAENQVAVLVLVRGEVRMDQEFTDFAASSGVPGLSSRQEINGASCVADAGGTVAFCVRSSRTLTVEVATIGRSINDAAAAVQEVWRLQ